MEDATGAYNIGHLLLTGFKWFDAGLRASLSAQGLAEITPSQSLVFAHLDREGTTTSELARRIGVTRQAVQQQVGELVAAGLLATEPEPGDRRARRVVLTATGRRSVTAALATFAALEDELATRIGPSRVTALRAALERDWGAPPSIGPGGPRGAGPR